MLELAHRGYEYQDLLCAIFLVDLLLGRAKSIAVDQKRTEEDRFDDLRVVWPDDRNENFQFKRRETDGPLELSTFTNDGRRCLLSKLVLSVAKSAGSSTETNETFRLVVTDGSPIDPLLASALIPPDDDPGPFLPGQLTQRYRFKPSVLWPPGAPVKIGAKRTARGKDVWAGIRNGTITRAQLEYFCDRFILETGSPHGSLDTHAPGPAERVLFRRIVDDVGVGTFPNQDRRPIEMAEAMLGVARAARSGKIRPSLQEVRRRSGLMFDFGSAVPVQPVDPSTEVKRIAWDATFIDPIQNAAKNGGVVVVLGPPGQGKSWACSSVVELLRSRGWIIASHHCYWNEDDPERERRVLVDVILGSLLHQLIGQTAGGESRPALGVTLEKLRDVLEHARAESPAGHVALIVDGLDHITRVLGRPVGSVDPSLAVSQQLARLALPAGTVMIVACQPGAHVEPFRDASSVEVMVPPWTDSEVGQLAQKVGVLRDDQEPSDDGDWRPPLGTCLATELIQRVTIRSAGNPLHATYLLRGLIVDPQPSTLREALGRIPESAGTLDSYYLHLLRPIGEEMTWLPEALAIMDFSVSRTELREIFPAQKRSLDKILTLLGPVLTEKVGSGGVRVYHESFARYLLSRLTKQDIQSALRPILEWLRTKGEFVDSRAFRNIPSMLARLDRHQEVTERGTVHYLQEAIRSGFGAQAILRNLRCITESAGRIDDWCTVTKCMELARSADTFEEERIEVLAVHAAVPRYILGREVFEERLFFEGRTVLPYRAGLLYCDAIDAMGESAPWRDYIATYRRGVAADKTFYLDDDCSIDVAHLVGVIRTAEPGMLELARVSEWLCSCMKRVGRDRFPAYAHRRRVAHGAFRALRLGQIARVVYLADAGARSDLALAFAELLRRRGHESAARRWASYAAECGFLPGRAFVAASFDASLIPSFSALDMVESLTADVHLVDTVRFATVRFYRWLDFVVWAARQRPQALTAIVGELERPGWYYGFLKFVVSLARAYTLPEAADQGRVSGTALGTLRLLQEDLSSSSTVPTTMLWSLHGEVEELIRRALRLVSDDDWPEALQVVVSVSRDLQGVSERGVHPFPRNLVRKLSLELCTPERVAQTLQILTASSKSSGHKFYVAHAEGEIYLSRIAMLADMRAEAEEHWRRAVAFFLAYGFRKDVTIFELLDGMESVSAVPDREICARMASLHPLVERACNHEDNTISYAVEQWWGLLGRIDPAAAVSLIRRSRLDSQPLIDLTSIDAACLGVLSSHAHGVDAALAASVRSIVDGRVRAEDIALLLRLADPLRAEHEPVVSKLIAKFEEVGLADVPRGSWDSVGRDLVAASGKLRHGTLLLQRSEARSEPRVRYPAPLNLIERSICLDLGSSLEQVSRALQVWRFRAIGLDSMVRESARFIAAGIGWRALSAHSQGDDDGARSLLRAFADAVEGDDAASAFSDLGMGFERNGAQDLAVVSYVYAFTRSRGGGGWLNFGGAENARWASAAVRLNRKTALSVLADEVVSLFDTGRYRIPGVSRALVALFAQLSEVSAGASGLRIWDAAFEVISSRLIAVDADDGPGLLYEPLCSSGIDSTNVFIGIASALVLHPGRDKKRQALNVLAGSFGEWPEATARAILSVLHEVRDESTLIWLLQLLIHLVQGLRPGAVGWIAEAIRPFSFRASFGGRVFARELLIVCGENDGDWPAVESVPERSDGPLGGESMTRARGLLHALFPGVLEDVDGVIRGFSWMAESRLSNALVRGDVRAEFSMQHDTFCRDRKQMPQAIFAIEKAAVRALGEVAGGGRHALASQGFLVREPDAWEGGLARRIYGSALPAIGIESARVPFCALPSRYLRSDRTAWERFRAGKVTADVSEWHDAPVVDGYDGFFSGWRTLGVLETRATTQMPEDVVEVRYVLGGLGRAVSAGQTDVVRLFLDGHALVGFSRETLGRLWYIDALRGEILEPDPWLGRAFGLRPCRDRSWCLYDADGCALAWRIWRSASSARGRVFVPEYWGMDLVLRPDLFDRLGRILDLQWFVSGGPFPEGDLSR